MSSEGAGHRPLSPPHSSDSDFGFEIGQDHFPQIPYTPPRSIRPTSSEPAYGPYGYDDQSSYPPPPSQPIYYSPQPTFVRHINYRSSPSHVTAPRTTRSGRTLGSPIATNASGRVTKSPRLKKKATKAHKKGPAILTGPLSELTKDYDIPVKDMEAWVNRPVEDRMKEVEKKKGYVSRPMNSFMLYRSAYAERVKKFCKENNHQVVSQVTGQSWPMEPKEVRGMYERYAIIERDNHAAANPGYKFAPNKSGKKHGHVTEDSDSDGEWEGPRANKRNRTRHAEHRSLSSTPFEPDARYGIQYPPPRPHPSSYQSFAPDGPVPFDYPTNSVMGSYYQPQSISYHNDFDDTKFERIDHHYPVYDMGSSLIGMPDSDSNSLLGARPIQQIHDLPPEQMVDPRLAYFDPQASYMYPAYDPAEGLYDVPRTTYTHCPAGDTLQGSDALHPGMATLTGQTDSWTPPGQPGSDFDRELSHF